MTIRATDATVRAAIETQSSLGTGPFIRTANVLTNKIASKDSAGELGDALLAEIETYLAAHFYALYDQQYSEKKTGDASGVYQGKTDMRLDSTIWGQTALMLDVTGYLKGMSEGKARVSLAWAGKPPSEQTLYRDRD